MYYPPPGASPHPPPSHAYSAPPGPGGDPYAKQMESQPSSLGEEGDKSSGTGSTTAAKKPKEPKEKLKRGGAGVVVGGVIGGTLGIVGGPAGVAFGAAVGAGLGGAIGSRSGQRSDERNTARNAAKSAADLGMADHVADAPNVFNTPTPGPLTFEIVICSDKKSGIVLNEFGQELFKWSPQGYKLQFLDSQGNCPFVLQCQAPMRRCNNIKILETMNSPYIMHYKGTSELTNLAKVKSKTGETMVRLQRMQKEMQIWLMNESLTKKFGSITFTSDRQKLMLDVMGGTDVHMLMSIACCYLLDVNHGGKLISFDKN